MRAQSLGGDSSSSSCGHLRAEFMLFLGVYPLICPLAIWDSFSGVSPAEKGKPAKAKQGNCCPSTAIVLTAESVLRNAGASAITLSLCGSPKAEVEPPPAGISCGIYSQCLPVKGGLVRERCSPTRLRFLGRRQQQESVSERFARNQTIILLLKLMP